MVALGRGPGKADVVVEGDGEPIIAFVAGSSWSYAPIATFNRIFNGY